MSSPKPALVGGFVLSGIALGVGAILLFGTTHLWSRTVHAVVYFRGSVAGLDVGAPVTFRGVRVGAVTSVSVNLNMPDLTARIPVYLDLNPAQISLENTGPGQNDADFDRLLKAGLEAQLTMQSLITGQLRVDLDLLPGVVPLLIGGDPYTPEIPSVPSRLQTIEDEVAELPLKAIAENARQALASVQRLADELTAKVGPLADALTTKIGTVSDSVAATSDAARTALGDIDQLAIVGKHQLAVSGADLDRVLASSDRTVRAAETLVGSMTEMTAADSPLRGDLRATLRDLAASASSMRGFTHEIERDPSSILSGRTGN